MERNAFCNSFSSKEICFGKLFTRRFPFLIKSFPLGSRLERVSWKYKYYLLFNTSLHFPCLSVSKVKWTQLLESMQLLPPTSAALEQLEKKGRYTHWPTKWDQRLEICWHAPSESGQTLAVWQFLNIFTETSLSCWNTHTTRLKCDARCSFHSTIGFSL